MFTGVLEHFFCVVDSTVRQNENNARKLGRFGLIKYAIKRLQQIRASKVGRHAVNMLLRLLERLGTVLLRRRKQHGASRAKADQVKLARRRKRRQKQLQRFFGRCNAFRGHSFASFAHGAAAIDEKHGLQTRGQRFALNVAPLRQKRQLRSVRKRSCRIFLQNHGWRKRGARDKLHSQNTALALVLFKFAFEMISLTGSFVVRFIRREFVFLCHSIPRHGHALKSSGKRHIHTYANGAQNCTCGENLLRNTKDELS